MRNAALTRGHRSLSLSAIPDAVQVLPWQRVNAAVFHLKVSSREAIP